MPGDTVSITVKLINPIAMEEGLRFAMREAGKTVGAGVVAAILDGASPGMAKKPLRPVLDATASKHQVLIVDRLIHLEWSSDQRMAKACLRTWHAIALRSAQPEVYTFDELAELTGKRDVSRALQVVLYLSNPKVRVLELRLTYQSQGNSFRLSDHQVQRRFEGDVVLHPETGAPITDSDIAISFTPGSRLTAVGAL